MLWVYGHHRYFTISVRGSTLDVYGRQIPMSIQLLKGLSHQGGQGILFARLGLSLSVKGSLFSLPFPMRFILIIISA